MGGGGGGGCPSGGAFDFWFCLIPTLPHTLPRGGEWGLTLIGALEMAGFGNTGSALAMPVGR